MRWVLIALVALGIVGAGVWALERFVRIRPKAPEARLNLAAIRTAEFSYFKEFGAFVPASPTPPQLPRSERVAWPSDPRVRGGFQVMGWAPEGRIRCQYAVAVDGEAFTAEALCAQGETIVAWGYVQPAPGHSHGIQGPFGRCEIRGVYNSAEPESYELARVGPCDEQSVALVY